MAINISFVADVRSFLKGTGDAAKGLEDVSDSLDDLTREADRASDKIGDDLEQVGDDAKAAGRDIDKGITDGVKDAESAGERLEKTFRETFDAAKKESKQAGDDIGDNVRRGTKKAEEGLDEFKDEANSTAREGAASFTGQFDDVADVIQETLANAFIGFGPAGAAAGLAAAAGVGILLTALQQASDKANDMTEEAAAFGLEWQKSDVTERVGMLRDRWEEVATAIADVRSVWEVWQPRAITNIERLADGIKDGYVNAGLLNDAFNDESPQRRLDALRSIMEETAKASEDLNQAVDDSVPVLEFAQDAAKGNTEALVDRLVVSEDVLKIIKDQIAQEEAAIAVTEALAVANGETVEAYRRREAAEADAEAATESYKDAVADMGDATDIYNAALETNKAAIEAWAEANGVSVEEATSAWADAPLTLDEVLNELSARVAAEKAFQDNLTLLAERGYGALADEMRAGGPEANSAVTDMLAKGTDAQVQQFAADQGSLLGKDLTQGAASGVTDSASGVNSAVQSMYEGLPTFGITIPVQVDDRDARTALANLRRDARIEGRIVYSGRALTGMEYQ